MVVQELGLADTVFADVQKLDIVEFVPYFVEQVWMDTSSHASLGLGLVNQ